MKQVDFILFEFRRRAQQKVEENMIKKIKSAELSKPALSKKEIELNNQYITTSRVVM